MYNIFEYREFASCNFLDGNTNSFKVKIDNTGTVEYELEDSEENTLELHFYEISKESVSKISDIINKNEEIFEVNSYLNNGSLDGSGNEFFFSNNNRNRLILAWNIDDSIDEGEEIRTEYLKEYGENLKQERLVLKVFYEICKVLKKKKYIWIYIILEQIEKRNMLNNMNYIYSLLSIFFPFPSHRIPQCKHQ